MEAWHESFGLWTIVFLAAALIGALFGVRAFRKKRQARKDVRI